MVERLQELYAQYSEEVMIWYGALPELYQYGVVFLLIVCGLLMAAFFMLSRITK